MRARIAALAALVGAACLEAPVYEGRACDPAGRCPSGLECVAGLCARGAGDDAGAADALASDAAGGDATDARAAADDGGAGDGGALVDGGGARADGGGAPDAAVGGCEPEVEAPLSGWEARHFTLDPSGDLEACQRVESIVGDALAIDRPAGGGPLPGVERYGSRYRARRALPVGVHYLALAHQGGLRVWLDGDELYEEPRAGTWQATVHTPYLEAGVHELVVEHTSLGGAAAVHVALTRGCVIGEPTDGWSRAYFARGASGEADRDHCYGVDDERTDFVSDSWLVPPRPVRDAAAQSWVMVARARRTLFGRVVFSATHEGPLRLRVSNGDALDAWASPGSTQVLLTYARGPHTLELEAADQMGDGEYEVSWQTVCALLEARPLITTEWAASYYRVVVSGTTWALDRNDCLGGEVLASEWLDTIAAWQVGGPVSVIDLGVQDLWGGLFRTRRELMAAVAVNVSHDDGLRVRAGGGVLYEAWTAPQVTVTTLTLPSGGYELALDYFENFGGAGLRMAP